MNNRSTTITGSVGRFLRIAIGVFLIAAVIMVYFRVDSRLIAYSIGIALLLTIVYGLMHFLVLKYLTDASPWLGAVLALSPLILVYALGSSRVVIFGLGRGQLAAALFLGVSLVLAGLRGDPGCEVMSIPNSLFREQTHLACLFFSPIDWVERKIQRK
jgi:hypothetical protein